MGVFSRISEGLGRSRDKFKERMNILLDRGPNLDEEFWEDLEETLILSDIGPEASVKIVSNLRDRATRLALPDAYAVLDYLSDEMVGLFTESSINALDFSSGVAAPSALKEGGDSAGSGADEESSKAIFLFVGINGTGKTTTVGKLAKAATAAGRKVILGSADTFRAAAIEQLEVWAKRSGVEVVERERGADPASVAFSTIERAEAIDADLVLIDTAGRLHTSADLMRELKKVVNVVRKRAKVPVYTVLVIDATTGQNGIVQAREFNDALHLDGLIVTKLDGTAKGGIALAISQELKLPILKIGVGEQIDDLRDFNAKDYVTALIGDFEQVDIEEDVEDLEEDNFVPEEVNAEEAKESVEVEPETNLSANNDFNAEESFSEEDENISDAEDVEDAEPDFIEAEPEFAEDQIDGGAVDSDLESQEFEQEELEQDDEPEQDQEPAPKKKHFWQKWF